MRVWRGFCAVLVAFALMAVAGDGRGQSAVHQFGAGQPGLQAKGGADADVPAATPGKSSIGKFTFPSVSIGNVNTPYPATVNVTGMDGTVIRVRPRVRLSHGYIQDVQLLLVAPSGQAVQIMNSLGTSGDGFVASDESYIMEQDALNPALENVGGRFSPTVGAPTSFPPTAPPGPRSRDLRTFNGINPNGVWQLFAYDNYPSADNGTIHEVVLEIETATCEVNINDGAPASQYPINLGIWADPSATVETVRVEIENLQHSWPDDIRMLLVSPTGEKCYFMGNCGGSADVVNLDLAIQDGATPLSDASIITSGTYTPTVFGTVSNFTAPAPAGPYGTSLNATFAGIPISGTWQVYILDDSGSDAGCVESVDLIITSQFDENVYQVSSTFMGSTSIVAAGSATGWSNFGQTAASFVGGPNYFSFPITAHPTKTRTSGVIRNKDGWLSVSGGPGYMGIFAIQAANQANPADFNQIPNLRARVQQRFALNSMLEVFHHTGDNAAQTLLEQELRPTQNPLTYSVYFVPLRPVETPRSTSSGEGVQIAFEAYGNMPQDQGQLRATDMQIYYENPYATPLDLIPAKSYNVSSSDAGALKVFNAAAELQNLQYNFGPEAGDPPVLVPGDGGTYSENQNGVTLSTVGQSSTPPVRIVSRNFNPENGGTAYTSRLRIEENKLYHARFHVTSTQLVNRQSQLRFRARCVKFSYSQKLELGGVYAAGATSNGIARNIVPGLGCLIADQRRIGEYGGWYTLSMFSPLNRFTRPEFSGGTAISTRMPNISGQPGPGVAAASRRDIFFGADVLDTLSTATGFANEAGQMTIDRVDVHSFGRNYN